MKRWASALLGRAGRDAEDAVERAGAHQTGGQRHDPDQVEPAIAVARIQEEPGEQREADDDSQDTIDTSDILGHGTLHGLTMTAVCHETPPGSVTQVTNRRWRARKVPRGPAPLSCPGRR